MGRVQVFPLLIIPALLYALIAIPSGDRVAETMAAQAFAMPLASGALWSVTWGQLIVMLSVIVCFILWLLVRPFGTSEFFIIVLMALLDFLAGSVIMTRVSQRTVQYDQQ
jgi:F0F1-type ATP synthase assembly protein I